MNQNLPGVTDCWGHFKNIAVIARKSLAEKPMNGEPKKKSNK